MAFLRIPFTRPRTCFDKLSAAFRSVQSTSTGQHLPLEAGETKEALYCVCVCVCVPDRQHSGIRSAVTFRLCVQILCEGFLVTSRRDYTDWTGSVCRLDVDVRDTSV